MNLIETVSEILKKEVTAKEAVTFAANQFGTLSSYLRQPPKPKRILSICVKCSDAFTARLFSMDEIEPIATHDGYVPDFMPEEHYGDYVELDIDIDTGRIINWKTPTDKELKTQLNGE